jgi:hypothetical protein
MTKDELAKMTGAAFLRLLVQNLGACREGFLDPFTVEQLIQIGRMHLISPWDFYPDQWTARQVKEALAGNAPHWTNDEKPHYGPAYWVRTKTQDRGLFTSPEVAGRAWPAIEAGAEPVTLVADYRNGTGIRPALQVDVDKALGAMLRAKGRKRGKV